MKRISLFLAVFAVAATLEHPRVSIILQEAYRLITSNGLPFEPGTAEFWDDDPDSGWVYEAKSGFIDLGLDENNAHVQPHGEYHYHGIPTGLLASLNTAGKQVVLVGWAADGFPIYVSLTKV